MSEEINKLKYTDTYNFLKKEINTETFSGLVSIHGKFTGAVFMNRLADSVNEFMTEKCSDLNAQLSAERLKNEKLRGALVFLKRELISMDFDEDGPCIRTCTEALKETEVK